MLMCLMLLMNNSTWMQECITREERKEREILMYSDFPMQHVLLKTNPSWIDSAIDVIHSVM